MKQPYSILKLIVFLFSAVTYAQGEANIWYFGNQAGLDFTGPEPVAIYNGSVNAIEGCATYCDAQGNLLFYTNGIKVWNKHHGTMPNGTGLFGDFSSSQAAIIVPKPGSQSLFYIFTTNPFDTDGGLRYSVVDMSANANTGAVIAKNMLLTAATCEKVSVVRHSNGQDYWLVSHMLDSNAYCAFRLTASGVSPGQTVSYVGCAVPSDGDLANAIGYMKFSNDGTRLVSCHTGLGKAELFDFDATTGLVTNPREICDAQGVYGAEFSPDNNVLYISGIGQSKLFQFDLTAENVSDSKTVVASFAQTPGGLQLAPNGKIYIAMAEVDKLSVINNPNQIGASCNVGVNSVDLGGRISMLGLPNFNQSIFYSKITADNLCANNNATFAFEADFTPTSVWWNFGDASEASQANSPSHHYSSPGNYTVTVTANYDGGSITRSKNIRIITPAPPTQIPPQVFCVEPNEVYQLSSNDSALLGEQSGNFSITYFASLAHAQAFTNPLGDNYVLTPGEKTIYAVIKSLSPGGCDAIVSFTLLVYANPAAPALPDFEMCDGVLMDNKAEFDLQAKTDEILYEPGMDVKYYETQHDAETATSPIEAPYTNTTQNQTVYVRITGGGGCFKVLPLRLVVKTCNTSGQDDVFPKFFTPNGDGYNDTWKPKATETSAVTIHIFDRYGKLLKTITPNDPSWDGTFGGRDLPSDDYWFVLTGRNVREIKGHFALKR